VKRLAALRDERRHERREIELEEREVKIMTFDPIKQWRDERLREQAEAEAEARDRFDEQQRERARLAYTAAGGTDDGFTKEWPELHKELLREQTISTLRTERWKI
jgi:flagellar biosynthesis/type III secretory pathway protein FliH